MKPRTLACLLPVALILPLAACSGSDDEPEGAHVAQLELLSVQLTGATGDEYEAISGSGALTVTGSERDFTLSIADEAGPLDVEVHSPGLSDLGALDGATVTVDLSTADFSTGTRTIVISDESGPLYAADHGTGSAELAEAFGAGFVGYGETLGTESREGYDWVYYTARFETDDGAVELEPGEVDTLSFDGVLWRVAVIAAYESSPQPDTAVPACGGSDDLLSYEMLRVEEPAEPAVLVRPEGAKVAALSCGG